MIKLNLVAFFIKSGNMVIFCNSYYKFIPLIKKFNQNLKASLPPKKATTIKSIRNIGLGWKKRLRFIHLIGPARTSCFAVKKNEDPNPHRKNPRISPL